MRLIPEFNLLMYILELVLLWLTLDFVITTWIITDLKYVIFDICIYTVIFRASHYLSLFDFENFPNPSLSNCITDPPRYICFSGKSCLSLDRLASKVPLSLAVFRKKMYVRVAYSGTYIIIDVMPRLVGRGVTSSIIYLATICFKQHR